MVAEDWNGGRWDEESCARLRLELWSVLHKTHQRVPSSRKLFPRTKTEASELETRFPVPINVHSFVHHRLLPFHVRMSVLRLSNVRKACFLVETGGTIRIESLGICF